MSPILYVYDGKMRDVGIDAVVRRQLEALVTAGFPVELVARGPASIPGVVEHIHRRSLANLISWLPRAAYYGAQRRIITGKAAELLGKKTYSLVIAWPQRALHAFRAAGKTPCLLNCDTLHYQARRGKHRTSRWPEISPAEMDEEYANASQILVPSEYSRQTFLKHEIDPGKLTILGRGIDPIRFSPAAIIDKDRPFRIVFCGRVSERKGIRQILEAWHLAQLKNAQLLVIGEIAEDARSLVAAEKSPLVKFLGYQSAPEEILRKCDAQILLSRTEGMAKSLLEGAACGLATLTTCESGFPLEEGKNGFFVERKKTAAVAERIRFLAQERSVCRMLGAAGRATILSDYTTEKFNARFLSAVRGLISNQ